MQIKVISNKNIPIYKRSLLKLYDPEKKRPKEYWKSLKNSTCVVIAFEDGEVIGASRIITDFYMCAMIFDVFVASNHRKKGIGWKIMKKTVDFCLEKNIKNISLVTDPSYPWLPDFYKKFGFRIDGSKGTYMIL